MSSFSPLHVARELGLQPRAGIVSWDHVLDLAVAAYWKNRIVHGRRCGTSRGFGDHGNGAEVRAVPAGRGGRGVHPQGRGGGVNVKPGIGQPRDVRHAQHREPLQCQGCGRYSDAARAGDPHNCWRNEDGTYEEGGTFQ
jgi:hypothetical protein